MAVTERFSITKENRGEGQGYLIEANATPDFYERAFYYFAAVMKQMYLQSGTVTGERIQERLYEIIDAALADESIPEIKMERVEVPALGGEGVDTGR